MRKPNEQPTNDEDKQCKHNMCILLPPNYVGSAELQPIEESEEDDWTDFDTNFNASDKTSPLLDWVMESNWNNKLCSKICLYLANPKELEKLNAYLKGMRMENGLLIKGNRLWAANKGQLQLEVIKKIHD